MPRTLIVLALTLVAGLVPTRELTAQLAFEPAVIDLGEVKSGQPWLREVRLVNKGREAVRKIELQASCGCLKAVPAQALDSLLPGQAAVIRLDANTLNTFHGPQHWRVFASYDPAGSSERSATALDLIADLLPEIVVQPPSLSVSSTKATTHQIRVIDPRRQPLAVRQVECANPHVTAIIKDEIRDSQGRLVRTIELLLPESLPPGRYDEQLVIHTNDPDYPRLRVELAINRRSLQRVTALPNEVYLGASAADPEPRRQVRLRDSKGGPVRVAATNSDHPAVTCVVEDGKAGPTILIAANATQMTASRMTAKVVVKFSDPAGETLTIPVTCELK